MNKDFEASFERAMSVLNRAKNFGTRIRFVFVHDTFGNFGLDGKVVELDEKHWLFRGVDSLAYIDWGTCRLSAVEDMHMPGSEFSFLWHFKLGGENFFSVAGIEPLPPEPSGLVN